MTTSDSMPPGKLAQQILARAGEMRAGKLPSARQTYRVDELEQLARAYLALDAVPRQTLADHGQVYVTPTASATYATEERIRSDEDARRELTALLLDARRPHPDDEPDKWRMRSRSSGLDIAARIEQQGRLWVVTHIGVRPANVGGRRG